MNAFAWSLSPQQIEQRYHAALTPSTLPASFVGQPWTTLARCAGSDLTGAASLMGRASTTVDGVEPVRRNGGALTDKGSTGHKGIMKRKGNVKHCSGTFNSSKMKNDRTSDCNLRGLQLVAACRVSETLRDDKLHAQIMHWHDSRSKPV
jgi:hypothetical protein